MKLSIYLFRDDVKSFDGLLAQSTLEGDGAFVEAAQLTSLPFECRGYVHAGQARPPSWRGFIDKNFDLSPFDVVSSSNSFVLLLKVKERVFAVTFGYGHLALERSKLEPQFGLRVGLNSVDGSRLRTIETRSVDHLTRQRLTNVSIASPLWEFGLRTDVDLLRSVAGRPASTAFARNVSGSDSLAITCDCTLEELGEKCSQLLEVWTSDAYKDQFAFVDHLVPLTKYDPMLVTLERWLEEMFTNRATHKVSLANPSVLESAAAYSYRVSRGHHHCEIEELDIEELYTAVEELDPDKSARPEEIKMVAVGPDGAQVTPRQTLLDYLVVEFDHAGSTYLFSLGAWIRIGRDFRDKVRNRAQTDLLDLTAVLGLPASQKGESEDAYNARVSNQLGWLLMDKALFHVPGSQDKVEVCDLLTPARQFVCVKKASSSATLSHLFAQASVSASLLRRDPEYRATIERSWKEWSGTDFDSGTSPRAQFVYAVQTRKPGPLPSSLFLFSVVNLLTHADVIRTANFDPAICRIGID